MNSEGKLIIAGTLDGTLNGNKVVTVKGSRVVARAEVMDMVVAGDFEGDLTALNSLKILRTGNLRGNIACKTLSMEAGGKLNGNVRPLEASVPVAPETDSKAQVVQTPSETQGDLLEQSPPASQ